MHHEKTWWIQVSHLVIKHLALNCNTIILSDLKMDENVYVVYSY